MNICTMKDSIDLSKEINEIEIISQTLSKQEKCSIKPNKLRVMSNCSKATFTNNPYLK